MRGIALCVETPLEVRMLGDIKTIKFKISDSVVEVVEKQTKFPKSKRSRIRKKWYKKYTKKEIHPRRGLVLLGCDWNASVMFAKVHPVYYEEVFKFTVVRYNNDPNVPDMILVED